MIKQLFKAAGLSLAGVFVGLLIVFVGGRVGHYVSQVVVGGNSPTGLEHEFVEAGFALVALLVYSFVSILWYSRRRSKNELRVLEAERRRLSGRQETDGILQRKQLYLTELKEHFTIWRNHARYSFVASMTGATAALVTIIAAVFFRLDSKVGDDSLALLSGISSALSSFLGATFLLLYKRSSAELRTIREELSSETKVFDALRESERLGADGKAIRARYVSSVLGTNQPEGDNGGSRVS